MRVTSVGEVLNVAMVQTAAVLCMAVPMPETRFATHNDRKTGLANATQVGFPNPPMENIYPPNEIAARGSLPEMIRPAHTKKLGLDGIEFVGMFGTP